MMVVVVVMMMMMMTIMMMIENYHHRSDLGMTYWPRYETQKKNHCRYIPQPNQIINRDRGMRRGLG
jgi:hypothetical protein